MGPPKLAMPILPPETWLLRRPTIYTRIRQCWAFCAIGLGLWEATAISTRRIPTITDTCRHYRTRKLGALTIGLWWIGLGHHLLRSKPR